ncbi:MAG: phosphate acyltransferase, partial [Alphaproteobacteria bacterium]
AALDAGVRHRMLASSSTLSGAANLLIAPGLDAASIGFTLVRQLANGTAVGPMLIGVGAPAHIAQHSATVRGILNLSAFAVVDAQIKAAAKPVVKPKSRRRGKPA